MIQRIDEPALRTVIPLRGIVRKIPQIVARAEGIPRAMQEHNPCAIVLGRSIEQIRHRRVHTHRQRVFLLRAVELNTQDGRWKMQSHTHRRYNAAVCFIMNVFDPRVPCKHSCRWIAPYGYVRNASCPKHD
jgi:hypothetical protein